MNIDDLLGWREIPEYGGDLVSRVELRNAIIKRCKELLEREIVISARQLGKTRQLYMKAGACEELMRFGNIKEEDLK